MRALAPLLLAGVGCAGDTGDDGVPTEPAEGPPTLVAASRGTTIVAWPDLAWAPDGTLYVSWVEIDADEVSDVYVARSDDGGRTFGPKALVDDVDTLFLGTVRQPVLAVDDARVAVVVGGGSYLDSSILLYVADRDTLQFEGRVLDSATLLDGTGGTDKTLVDQPELVFLPSGDLWVNWKQGTRNESFQLVLATESGGWAVERLEDGVAGEPCECCPTDFHVADDGEILLAFRNNQRNLRELYLAVAPPGGAFSTSYQLSTTGWEIGGCPFDGPSITATPDGSLFATWADASEGDNYQWFATSADQGRTWTPSARVEPDNDESVTWPTAVTAPDGTVWLSTVEIYHQTNLHTTVDGGATFVSHDASSPGGPLFYSELAAGPEGIGLVGVTETGELWFLAPG